MDNDFVSHDGIKWNGHVGTVQYGNDSKMVVMFFNKGVQNQAKSAAAGRPVFEESIFVRIHPPGERLNIIERPANDSDKRRFPMQWAQFQENRQQIPDGTPIDLLYPDHPAVAQNLRGWGVHTIEQCADLSANAIESIGMGSQRYVNDAQKYIASASKGVGAVQLRRELEERDNRIRTLESQIAMLQRQIEHLSEVASSRVDVSAVQAALAGVQTRPTYPRGARQLDPAFDAASAQIAAVHPTREIAATKNKKAVPAKRQRARIQA